MARQLNKLTPAKVKSLGAGLHNDGEGLYLRVRENGTRSWVFRYRSRDTQKLRDRGLGPATDLSLPEARDKARQLRVELRQGMDPIDTHKKARAQAIAAVARQVTFKTCADAYIAKRRPIWRNAKHAQQWPDSLADYCGSWERVPVSAIDTGMVMKVVEPRWETHNPTASRVLQRIERILDYAKACGYRTGENPARRRGHMDMLLPAPSSLKKVTHRPALPYAQMAGFVKELSTKDVVSSKALLLQILTAARPGEAVAARWCEFDLEAKIWTVPASRMKSNREHKVPLSRQALSLLTAIPRVDHDFLFPGVKGKAMTTAAMMKLLKSLRPGMTCHGFRSSFSDWAAENTDEPNVTEAALAHRISDAVVAAYRRTSLLDKRSLLMAKWADFCCT
jgi:integrase